MANKKHHSCQYFLKPFILLWLSAIMHLCGPVCPPSCKWWLYPYTRGRQPSFGNQPSFENLPVTQSWSIFPPPAPLPELKHLPNVKRQEIKVWKFSISIRNLGIMVRVTIHASLPWRVPASVYSDWTFSVMKSPLFK